MKKIMSKKVPDRIIGFEMCEDEYIELRNDYQGICMACGSTMDSCEPDAELYDCDQCEQPRVYGIEQLMLCGLIRLTDDKES